MVCVMNVHITDKLKIVYMFSTHTQTHRGHSYLTV